MIGRLCLGQIGPTTNPAQHLERLREQLYSLGDFVLNAMRAGKSEAEIIAMLKASTEKELQRSGPHSAQRYEIATNSEMTVQGYIRYWRKRHPERLQ